MSLKRASQQATKRAFRAMRSLRTKIIYNQLGDATYNPETKKNSRQLLAQKVIYGFLTDYKSEEVLAGIASPEDQRLTLEARTITFEVDEDDELEIKGETWRIIEIKKEPSEAVIIMRIAQK